MTHPLKRRMLYIPILHIDTNLINARKKLPAVNRLEQWYGDGVILINMAGTAREEALAGGKCKEDAEGKPADIYDDIPGARGERAVQGDRVGAIPGWCTG